MMESLQHVAQTALSRAVTLFADLLIQKTFACLLNIALAPLELVLLLQDVVLFA
jgi:hypothetical protein